MYLRAIKIRKYINFLNIILLFKQCSKKNILVFFNYLKKCTFQKQKKAALEKAKAELTNVKSNKIGAKAKIDDYKLYIANLETQLINQRQLYKNNYISKKEFETSVLDLNRSFFLVQSLEG